MDTHETPEQPTRRGRKPITLIGKKFGYLVPVERRRVDGTTFYRCLCTGLTPNCKTRHGDEVLVRHSNLVAGLHRSCGCMQHVRESRIGMVMQERHVPATAEDFKACGVLAPAWAVGESQKKAVAETELHKATDEQLTAGGFQIDDSEWVD